MKITCISDSKQHCAFTDLTYFRQKFYCAYREALAHMSLDGVLVIKVSDNGVEWQEHSRLVWIGGDMRDPKFSISPENKLILTAGIRWAVFSNLSSRLYSVGWQLEEKKWSEAVLDHTSENSWRWATTWHKGKAYSVGYAGKDVQGCLYRSDNGLNWKPWVKNFFPNTNIFTNESSLVSDKDTLWCLSRRDALGGANAVLGKASGNLKNWQWQELYKYIGGPKFFKLSSGEFAVAGRYINFKRVSAKTRLYKIHPGSGRLKLWRELPSKGDCSYPGLVELKDRLYVSYYSSHEDGQAKVFLAVIHLVSNLDR